MIKCPAVNERLDHADAANALGIYRAMRRLYRPITLHLYTKVV